MVCIIDDREDVWNFAPNLVTVKPYRFFKGTGDINDPFGNAEDPNGVDDSDDQSAIAIEGQEPGADMSDKDGMETEGDATSKDDGDKCENSTELDGRVIKNGNEEGKEDSNGKSGRLNFDKLSDNGDSEAVKVSSNSNGRF